MRADGVAVVRSQRWSLARLFTGLQRGDILARNGTVTWPIELAVGLSTVAAAVLARIAIEQVVGGVIPFVLTFPMVIVATLLAGARAGIVAAIGCQALVVFFVFPHWTVTRVGSTSAANLVLSSLALLLTIWATAAYRTAAAQLRQTCQREVKTLSLLIGEMDHRTKNNFQIAAALLSTQARASASTEVTIELQRAAVRLESIASVYRNLGLAGRQAHQLMLDEYLTEIVGSLRAGFVPAGIDLSLTSSPIAMEAHKALMIGLIVNEWVTNAVKYAFGDGAGTIVIDARQVGTEVMVVVADDGVMASAVRQPGIGSRLIQGLADAIDATITIERDHGTSCLLRVPEQRG
ncbi:sensor histidine kinase [Sphingomonas mollis]|uniref:histidine kinase n=1 Tax=Sphingomonas mollis TaxID=2795726 RepID=A0ABS0XKN8_9SPHN|nr:histidine kinase dimerization/phosphoacceptor domain -containing protein [Sphingomonas sp. BT553]MBJ6120273.1 sensor histidine kinase [Sphingomonas sp. BT553]